MDQLLGEHLQCIVGEIGLDKAARTAETGKCEYAQQKVVFANQCRLANKHQR
jgi:Tat protein secretion system quality control protein TatD with DNase activity